MQRNNDGCGSPRKAPVVLEKEISKLFVPDRTIARIFPDIYCLNGLRCERYSSDSMSRSLWFREVKYNHNDSWLTLPKKAMVNQDISLDLWEEWSNLKWKDKLQTAEEWISFSSQVMLMVTVRVRACFQWVETSWQQICGSFPDVKLSWQPLRVHPFKLNRDDRMWSLCGKDAGIHLASERSHLLPAIATTMLGGPCWRSSFTQFFNVWNDS